MMHAPYSLPNWLLGTLISGMIGALAFSLGLVFFVIIAMDRPFAGKESDNMSRWDTH